MASTLLIPLERLRVAVNDIMRGFGSDSREAQIVTDNLLQANLTGHDSHGIGMLPRYANAFLEGGLRPNGHVLTRLDSRTLLALDGQARLGQGLGQGAMQLGIARAQAPGR